jgi:hypothetical protein
MSEQETVVETTSEPQPQPLPKDLQDQLSAVRALASVHNLITNGTYGISKFEQVDKCIEFIKSLHEQCMQQCLSHPRSNEVPELDQVRNQREGN